MLLATDLDGTLALGEKEDILKVCSLFREHDLRLAYVTGRDIKNFKKLLKNLRKEKGIKLTYPDYLIALNGAKIYKIRQSSIIPVKRLFLDKSWNRQLSKGWNKKLCYQAFKKTAKKIRFGDDMPALIDVKYKPTPFYLESVVYYGSLDTIKQTLQEECLKLGIEINVIYDYLPKHYVDMGLKVLDTMDRKKANIVRAMRDEHDGIYVMQPSATTKGKAVQYLMNKLNLNKSQVIAAGDGGNDYHLLSEGFNSIIVNNAHEILLRQPLKALPETERANMHFVPYDGAKGLLEGLNIVLNKSFPHCGNSSLRSVINA